MSEYRQMIERLRELYLRLEAENITSLSEKHTLSALTPVLSAAKISTEYQSHYQQGFLDGIKFFQSCLQYNPRHTPSRMAKEGDLP